ncbi:hypothetical protein LCGC14_1018590 [marine sediment metagenome]|uniref:Uncharacterized protein n=1 Tax=marine sediment metagenome TaxID=412755 RepID=A0A0F9NJR7_9ZZZZ
MRRRLREKDGRFRRASLAGDFGLVAPICAACNGFNPRNVNDPLPKRCCQCGAPFVDRTKEAEA